MSLPVILRPEAEDDITSARDYYDRHAGIGQSFVNRVDQAIERIGDAPESYPFVRRDIRWYRTRRFPYIVYYRVRPDRIEILAVLHGRRDNSILKHRL